MRERLEKFMKIEGLVPSRFAEIMGVQPSSISHILGGRNKPSFDFLEKMLLRFPKVNPDWLLLGKGSMYRTMESATERIPSDTNKTKISETEAAQSSLFASSAQTSSSSQQVHPRHDNPTTAGEEDISASSTERTVRNDSQQASLQVETSGPVSNAPSFSNKIASIEPSEQKTGAPPVKDPRLSSRLTPQQIRTSDQTARPEVEKIVFIYSDKTFAVYTPETVPKP